MNKSKAILCGYHWVGCRALWELMRQFDEVFVYTHYGPHYVPDLVGFCKEQGIAYTTDKISLENLPFTPDIICSMYYRYIIGEDVISAVDGKIFNLHPSLLPKYRGCSSLTWAMINEEAQAGYTYHYVDPACDTGRIIIQKSFNIEPWDTQQSLYHRAMELAVVDFMGVVDSVLTKQPGEPQKGISSYYPRGCPHGGKISDDWDVSRIKAFIRAMINPPLPLATYKGQAVQSYSDYLKIKGDNL